MSSSILFPTNEYTTSSKVLFYLVKVFIRDTETDDTRIDKALGSHFLPFGQKPSLANALCTLMLMK